MYKNNKVLCVIPARGGSKGLPGKNIKNLLGKPLIAYTIEQARQSQYIDRIIVSTESDEIARISKEFGAEIPFIRPIDLSGDNVGTIDVLLHAIYWLEVNDNYLFDILVVLHVTAPLRNVTDIDNSIKLLVDENADNVFSVTESHRNPYFNMIEVNGDGKVSLAKEGNYTTRQSTPKVYDMNASIYVWWKEILKKKKRLFLKKTSVYIMPKERSLDIDSELDVVFVELLMKGNMNGKI